MVRTFRQTTAETHEVCDITTNDTKTVGSCMKRCQLSSRGPFASCTTIRTKSNESGSRESDIRIYCPKVGDLSNLRNVKADTCADSEDEGLWQNAHQPLSQTEEGQQEEQPTKNKGVRPSTSHWLPLSRRSVIRAHTPPGRRQRGPHDKTPFPCRGNQPPST